MQIFKSSELTDEHTYCKSCGGFVDMKNCSVLLTSPPIKQYYCKDCGILCLKVKED